MTASPRVWHPGCWLVGPAIPLRISSGHTPTANSCAALVGVDFSLGPVLVGHGSSEATDVVTRASCRERGSVVSFMDRTTV